MPSGASAAFCRKLDWRWTYPILCRRRCRISREEGVTHMTLQEFISGMPKAENHIHQDGATSPETVSYTHLTLPTNREV